MSESPLAWPHAAQPRLMCTRVNLNGMQFIEISTDTKDKRSVTADTECKSSRYSENNWTYLSALAVILVIKGVFGLTELTLILQTDFYKGVKKG